MNIEMIVMLHSNIISQDDRTIITSNPNTTVFSNLTVFTYDYLIAVSPYSDYAFTYSSCLTDLYYVVSSHDIFLKATISIIFNFYPSQPQHFSFGSQQPICHGTTNVAA
jgi:hypothetical protein